MFTLADILSVSQTWVFTQYNKVSKIIENDVSCICTAEYNSQNAMNLFINFVCKLVIKNYVSYTTLKFHTSHIVNFILNKRKQSNSRRKHPLKFGYLKF